MSPYQFCSNNPIWLREIDGLEGIKYTETDDQGNKKVIVEKNVVILTEKTKDIPAGATQKQTERIERKNAKIESRNAAKVASITKELNSFYNGEDGKGARDSKGTEVQFKFNVKPLQVANTSGGSRNEITNLALANGLKSSEVQFDGGPNKVAPAAVVTTGSTGGSQGLSNGVFVNVSAGAPSGAFAHEVGHTFTLPDNYQNGGIMASPPNQILPSEVDDIINSSYEK